MVRIFNHFVPRIAPALLCIEFFILMSSTYLGGTFRFSGFQPFSAEYEEFALSAFSYASVMVFSMAAFGLYRHDSLDGFRSTLMRLGPAFVFGSCVLALLFYLVPRLYLGRGVLGSTIFISFVTILALRVLLNRSSQIGLLKSRVIFLGGGELARECGRLLMDKLLARKYEIVGFVPMPAEECCVSSSALLPVHESLSFMAKKYNATEIVVSVQNGRTGTFPIKDLLECRLNGVKVTGAATLFEREACQIRVDSLPPSWLVFNDGFDQGMVRTYVKRIVDICASVTLFVVTLPVMLLTAAYIYAEDRGPVFYRQARVGRDGQIFKVIKFRSMRMDAEKGMAPQWAAKNDPRITKVGHIIRKLRIDELPQILNVIKGEMSFVGPRPERPYFVEQLSREVPYYNARHSVKPGITGFAQVRYPYGASVNDAIQKLQYDLYYVKNHSLFLDLLILIDTVQVVLLGKGAR